MGASGTDAAHFNGADLSHVVSELIKSVHDLKGQVAAHDELLSKMNRLEAENNDLRANMGMQNQDILRLRGLLSAADWNKKRFRTLKVESAIEWIKER